jgi:hypothetical protein
MPSFLIGLATDKEGGETIIIRFQEFSGSELKNMVSAGRGVVYIYLVLVLASHSANPLFSVSVHIANHP